MAISNVNMLANASSFGAYNQKLTQTTKQKLEKLKKQGKIKKDIYVFGFVNNVDVIMSAADVLIGKIGGVGIAEAFNKHLPIIANKKLPFQEYDNMLYLKERNACEYISKNSNFDTFRSLSVIFPWKRLKEMWKGIHIEIMDFSFLY